MLSRKTLKIIIVMGGVLLIALPFTYISKAETSDSFAGHWYVWEENVNVSGNQWISYQNVLFVTNDPSAMGQVQVNNTTSGPSNFIQTLDFSGTYTFYSHLFEQPFTLTNGLMPVATSNSRAFTSYTPIQSAHNVEIVQLSSTQIQSLISAIQNSTSYDDTTLLTQLAIIKGVLDNIDTSSASSATDIASLLNTSNSILNALNNLDNALDYISWSYLSNSKLSYATTETGSYIQTTGALNQTEIWIKLDTSNSAPYTQESILNLILPLDSSGYTKPKISQIEIVSISGNSILRNSTFNYYYEQNRERLSLYIYDLRRYGYGTGDWRIHIKFTNNIYVYNYSSSPQRYILSNDIEYWTLRAFFEQHQYFQNEYPDLENEQSDFNNEVDNYLTEEDALISDFQSAISNNAVSPSIPSANPSNWGNTFIQSIAFIGVVFNTLTGASLGGNAFYLMIQFSLMLGLALLIIGKRAI